MEVRVGGQDWIYVHRHQVEAECHGLWSLQGSLENLRKLQITDLGSSSRDLKSYVFIFLSETFAEIAKRKLLTNILNSSSEGFYKREIQFHFPLSSLKVPFLTHTFQKNYWLPLMLLSYETLQISGLSGKNFKSSVSGCALPPCLSASEC